MVAPPGPGLRSQRLLDEAVLGPPPAGRNGSPAPTDGVVGVTDSPKSKIDWSPNTKIALTGVAGQLASVLDWLVNDKLALDMPDPVLMSLAGLLITIIAYFVQEKSAKD
jgi:hypothetical protein